MSLVSLLQHFSFRQDPFARAVPINGLLSHPTFDEALARLRFAVEARSAALFTAEPGLGKSTLLGVLSDSCDTARTHIVYTPLCTCGPFGLVGQLATRYGVKVRRTAAQTAQSLVDDLTRSDKDEVIILDEAHRLPVSSLEELRLLTNSDFDRAPSFTVILAGQPQLRARLVDADLASLWQRIPVRTALSPLSDDQLVEYVERRMRAVGAVKSPFRGPALDKLFEHSRGTPRLINSIGLASLLVAATAGRKVVEPADVTAGASSVELS